MSILNNVVYLVFFLDIYWYILLICTLYIFYYYITYRECVYLSVCIYRPFSITKSKMMMANDEVHNLHFDRTIYIADAKDMKTFLRVLSLWDLIHEELSWLVRNIIFLFFFFSTFMFLVFWTITLKIWPFLRLKNLSIFLILKV